MFKFIKKIILFVIAIFLIVGSLIGLFIAFMMDDFLKDEISKKASSILKTDVKISSIETKLFEGTVKVSGIEIRNKNFKDPINLASLSSIKVSIDLDSLLSNDILKGNFIPNKVVVTEIAIGKLRADIVGDLESNNLDDFLGQKGALKKMILERGKESVKGFLIPKKEVVKIEKKAKNVFETIPMDIIIRKLTISSVSAHFKYSKNNKDYKIFSISNFKSSNIIIDKNASVENLIKKLLADGFEKGYNDESFKEIALIIARDIFNGKLEEEKAKLKEKVEKEKERLKEKTDKKIEEEKEKLKNKAKEKLKKLFE